MNTSVGRFWKGSCTCSLLALLGLALWACTSSPVGDMTTEKLKAMTAGGNPLLIVDTRSDVEFARGRIPGALHVPRDRFSSLPSLLGADKRKVLVFYCRGYG